MTLFELMILVAQHLNGWTWEGEQESERWHLVHTESGARVSAWGSGSWSQSLDCRIEFFVAWPQGHGHYYKPADHTRKSNPITIGAGRGPETIAKSLDRRLLATVPAEYAEQLEQLRKYNRDKKNAEDTAAEFASILGVKVWGQSQDKNRFSVGTDSLNLIARVELSGSIYCERLTLSKDLAAETFEFLRGRLQAVGEL